MCVKIITSQTWDSVYSAKSPLFMYCTAQAHHTRRTDRQTEKRS